MNWGWIGDERRKMIGKLMGIRNKIGDGIKRNYNVNAIYFVIWEGDLKGDLDYGKCITRG